MMILPQLLFSSWFIRQICKLQYRVSIILGNWLGADVADVFNSDFAFRLQDPLFEDWRQSWQEQLCQQTGQPDEQSSNLGMAVDRNYNPQSRKEVAGRGGQQRVQGGRYRTDLQNNQRGWKRGHRKCVICEEMHAAWETKSRDCSSAWGYGTMTSFKLLSCGGTTQTSRLLQWEDKSSSGKTGQEEDEGRKREVMELRSMWVLLWDRQHFV